MDDADYVRWSNDDRRTTRHLKKCDLLKRFVTSRPSALRTGRRSGARRRVADAATQVSSRLVARSIPEPGHADLQAHAGGCGSTLALRTPCY
jgi:hypothetical protein